MGRKTVLVVDDIKLIRNILTSFLRAENCQTLEASGGIEAVRLIEKEPIDLVILDIMMPDIDGLMVLDRVRKKKTPVELPIVIASALDEEADVEGALLRGANDYIIKPFTRAVIREKLERFLFSPHTEEVTGQASGEGPAAPADPAEHPEVHRQAAP